MSIILDDRPVPKTVLKPDRPNLYNVTFSKRNHICYTDEVIALKRVFRMSEDTAIAHVEHAAANGLSIVFSGSAEVAETKAEEANKFLSDTMYGKALLEHCWFTFEKRQRINLDLI